MFYASSKFRKWAPEIEIDRWHFCFEWAPSVARRSGRYLNLGLYKPLEFPPEGEVMQNKHYKGFFIEKDCHFGFAIHGAWNIPTFKEIISKIKKKKNG